MPFQYQYNQPAPLINSNQGLMDLLSGQINTLQSGGQGPQFGNTAGAFNTARNAAQARQSDLTAQQLQGAQEQAAASGKTFSSAALAEQGRVGQQGQNQLAEILGMLGLQEQGVLGQQAQATAGYEADRQNRINTLLSQVGSIQGGRNGSGSGFPSYGQQRQDYLADIAQQREFDLADQARNRGYQVTDRFNSARDQMNRNRTATLADRRDRPSQRGPIDRSYQDAVDFANMITGGDMRSRFGGGNPQYMQELAAGIAAMGTPAANQGLMQTGRLLTAGSGAAAGAAPAGGSDQMQAIAAMLQQLLGQR